MRKFRFVLATTNGVDLAPGHFGDSEFFIPGEVTEDGTIRLFDRIKNDFRNADESTQHGSEAKRKSIISYLGSNVDFIIAARMSPNFKRINRNSSVCPVVSDISNIEDLSLFLKDNFELLSNHMKAKAENRNPEVLRITPS